MEQGWYWQETLGATATNARRDALSQGRGVLVRMVPCHVDEPARLPRAAQSAPRGARGVRAHRAVRGAQRPARDPRRAHRQARREREQRTVRCPATGIRR